MSDARQTLRDLLAIHRAHVANYERQRALVRFDSALELQLKEERRHIARVKRKLRQLGVEVEEDALDGELDETNWNGARRWRTTVAGAPADTAAAPDVPDRAAVHFAWIVVLLAVTVGLAGLTAWTLRDLALTAVVLVFSLLTLGIVLPYIGLQSGRISGARWFRSYVATLRKMPGLGRLLK